MSTLRFIWADKLALIVASAMVGLFVLSEGLFLLVAGLAGAENLLDYFGTGTLEYSLALAVAFWLVLRGLDALFGGSTRALFRPRDRAAARAPHGALPV